MPSLWTWITVTAILCVLRAPSPALAQTCSKTYSSNRHFAICQDLQKLGATLAWTLYEANNTIEFAFSETALSTNGWVGWGINPRGIQMAGTQALITFMDSGKMTVKTYNVTDDVRNFGKSLLPGLIDVNFTDYTAEMTGLQVTIFTTLHLKPNQTLELNHVWNRGSQVTLSTFAPSQHDITNADDLTSKAAINMTTGASIIIKGDATTKLKNRHGIINTVSWGILLPVGVMAARYLRPFANPLWFYVHVSCQSIGYILGIAGWALGLQLQHKTGVIIHKHRNLGMSIFALATLQMLAILLRPRKDHKVRKFWNVYHRTIGYTTIILIIVNIFEGLKILGAAHKWRYAYIAILILLGVTSLLLEAITWILWLHRRRQLSSKALDMNRDDGQGAHGPANGHGLHNGNQV